MDCRPKFSSTAAFQDAGQEIGVAGVDVGGGGDRLLEDNGQLAARCIAGQAASAPLVSEIHRIN